MMMMMTALMTAYFRMQTLPEVPLQLASHEAVEAAIEYVDEPGAVVLCKAGIARREAYIIGRIQAEIEAMREEL